MTGAATKAERMKARNIAESGEERKSTVGLSGPPALTCTAAAAAAPESSSPVGNRAVPWSLMPGRVRSFIRS